MNSAFLMMLTAMNIFMSMSAAQNYALPPKVVPPEVVFQEDLDLGQSTSESDLKHSETAEGRYVAVQVIRFKAMMAYSKQFEGLQRFALIPKGVEVLEKVLEIFSASLWSEHQSKLGGSALSPSETFAMGDVMIECLDRLNSSLQSNSTASSSVNYQTIVTESLNKFFTKPT